jgi:hypothetical protein
MSGRVHCFGSALAITAVFCGAACSPAGRAERSKSVPVVPMNAPPGTGGVMLPPGDAEKAIRDQFAEAEKQNTQAAYKLFIDRYPDHPLAREATHRIVRLGKSQSQN